MGLASTRTVSFYGVSAHLVTVEVKIGSGLPGIHIVGLADTSISEARERVRTAIQHSTLGWPRSKITISLSPASLRKTGAHYDLSLAMGVLAAATSDPELSYRCASTMFLGELGLDGRLKPVPGVLSALMAARDEKIPTVIIPRANASEATLFSQDEVTVLVADSLSEVWGWAIGQVGLLPPSSPEFRKAQRSSGDMKDVVGQSSLIKAAEVAAAGGHHMLMIGPPGSGKSMIAARFPSILPELDSVQRIQATAIHSLSGLGVVEPLSHAPFIAPHHSVSRAALLGGGSGNPHPGAVSLAHHGVLFLDEVSEIPAPILDGLRTAIEDGEVTVMRARHEVTFPARFQLLMAANPCRCGADKPHQCRCLAHIRRRYLSNISGPLRDRLDIIVRSYSTGQSLFDRAAESSAAIAERVAEARDRAAHRWSSRGLAVRVNAHLSGHLLRRHFPADEAAMAMLEAYLARGTISQRGVNRNLRLAWTLCDLAGAKQPTMDHMEKAMAFHHDNGYEEF
ncbi:YifB family Mg chelatase-like AAA ATPase [Corynebacterium sp. 3HC-13]|uniref:YifB family Mg chelatase-like AAA ATPase n=1 Tax=Corynebacterium poyangense TaxID=2684405 RepID=UPI001CCFDC3C|nr:YifB family Mg chelatase-like AAA ATPase [Corynebacterium poyangense]MBZ8178052.1 YifB family Mg chelatase-like AAA ATPase [Corynebacterium poyangense]